MTSIRKSIGRHYLFLLILFFLLPGLPSLTGAHLSSEYNADKHTPFGESIYEISPQTGSMGISVQDLVLQGRAGHDLIIGRVYATTLANAYTLGVKSGTALRLPATHLDQKYGLGCGWGLAFPSIEINFDMQEVIGSPQYNLYLGNGGVYSLDFNTQNGISYYPLEDMKVREQDAGYSRSDQGFTISSWYSLTMKDQSKYYFDRWGNLLAMYDPSHRETNKIELFYQGGVVFDLEGYTYPQHAKINFIQDNCSRRVNFIYSQERLHTITWLEGGMERTITYQQELFETDQGISRYKLSQVIDAAGRITGYNYMKHEVHAFFGGSILGLIINYYADLTDIYYNCSGESFTHRLHLEYSEPEEYIKLFGHHNVSAGEREGFLWYYKVIKRWEEDRDGLIYNKVSLTYQGEAYRAITPEVFYGTGVIGYQTTVAHYLTEGTKDTEVYREEYGYHGDKHYLLRHHQRTTEGLEELTVSTYDDELKCPTKREIFRKSGTTGTYKKISEHSYTYDKYKDLLNETNEENIRTTCLYHTTYHQLIRKETADNRNAENVVNTNLLTWVIDETYGDILEQRQHLAGDISSYLTNWKREYHSLYGTVSRQEDALGHVTTYAYDPVYQAYPGKIIIHMTDSVSQEDTEDIVESFTYYPNGLKKTYTNPSGYTTSYTYDQADRLLTEVYQDNSFRQTIYDDLNSTKESIDEEGRKVKEYYNGLGHLLKNERYLADKSTIYSLNLYTCDSLGRKISSTDALGKTTAFEYDSQDRLIKTIYPDLSYNTIAYDDLNFKKTIFDANRHTPKITYEYDRLGRTVKVYEYAEKETCLTAYAYDSFNQRITANDAKDQVTKYVYDELNRLSKIIYPDHTFEVLDYDDAGNLTNHTDQRHYSIIFHYDYAHRLIRKVYPNTKEVNFSYYKNGKVKEEKDQDSTTSYTYNQRNWLTKKDQAIDGITYTTEYQYNKTGSCTGIKYPNHTDWLRYDYDDAHRIKTIFQNTIDRITYTYADFDYYPTDHLKQIIFGHGLSTLYTLDQRNRPVDITTSPTILNLHYEYDHENNILRENDTTYTYDYLDRLISAHLSDPAIITGIDQKLDLVREHFGYDKSIHTEKYLPDADLNRDRMIDGIDLILAALQDKEAGLSIVYSYDAVGNRQIQAEGEVTTTYTYSFNRLTRAEDSRQRIDYSYDENGNLIQKQITDLAPGQRTVWDYTFDYEDRLTQVKKDGQPIAAYTYDISGNRIKKILYGSSKTIIYHYDQWGNVIEETDTGGTVISEYIFSGDQHIARRENTHLSYYHSDLIKSARAITNEQGEKVWWRDYKPFGIEYKGEEMAGESGDKTVARTTYTFTGQEEDEETGLFYYGARYYDAGAGRFVSEDPAEADWDDPQSIHRYVYCRNNPLKYIDPTGEFAIIPILAGLWAAAEFALSCYDAYDTAGTVLSSETSWSDKGVAAGLFTAGVFLPGGGYSKVDDIAKAGEKAISSVSKNLPAVYDPKFGAKQLLDNGKISLEHAKSFVPKDSPNLFRPSNTIQGGQKYQFGINGTKVEFKIHSPDANAAARFPSSNSGRAWTAQIEVGNKLLGTDGNFYRRPSNLTHILLNEF